MAIHNVEIAEMFYKVANLLEIESANPFRVRAYRNAARVIEGLTKNLSDLIAQGEDLTELPGIGEDLAEKIKTIIDTHELPLLKTIEGRLPPILNELMTVEGLGPKRIQIIYKKLKIKNIEDLKTAISKGRLRRLKGFGEKIEQKILQGIAALDQKAPLRLKLADAFPIANSYMNYLKRLKNVSHIEIAGSFRRRKETVGDLDVLICSDDETKVMDKFVQFEEVSEVISHGTTRSAVNLHSGLRVDLRVVPKQSYGAALLYFTGSKDHNIHIRKMAVKRKLKINEYGVFKGKRLLPALKEADVYKAVGLPFIEPELREDRGEIEAALAKQLPKLITLDDIRGDLHCHTNLTDGTATLEAMAKAALALGYEYIAITDHSKYLAFTGGMNKKKLFAQLKAIDKLNATLKKLVILKSCEVDILEDGSLDLPNDVLKELDLTVCSIHSHFNLSEAKQTERVIRAMDNPYFTILAHPTGRLINQRKPYPINMDHMMRAAKDRGCILELNAQPSRLDLNDTACQRAKEMGVKIVISTDAHGISQFDYMQFGVYQARRGWLEKNDVINTKSLAELKKILRRSSSC